MDIEVRRVAIQTQRSALERKLAQLRRERAEALKRIDGEMEALAKELVNLEDEEDLLPGSAWFSSPAGIEWASRR